MCRVHLGFFFSSRRLHTRFSRDWSSDVCSSDLGVEASLARYSALCIARVWATPSIFVVSVICSSWWCSSAELRPELGLVVVLTEPPVVRRLVALAQVFEGVDAVDAVGAGAAGLAPGRVAAAIHVPKHGRFWLACQVMSRHVERPRVPERPEEDTGPRGSGVARRHGSPRI